MRPPNFSHRKWHLLEAFHYCFCNGLKLDTKDVLLKPNHFATLNCHNELRTLWKCSVTYKSAAKVSTHGWQLDRAQSPTTRDLGGSART